MLNIVPKDDAVVRKALDHFDTFIQSDETHEFFLAHFIHSVHDQVRGAALFLMKTEPDILTDDAMLDSAGDCLYQAMMSDENGILPEMARSVLLILEKEIALIQRNPCPEDSFWMVLNKLCLLMHRALTRRAEQSV